MKNFLALQAPPGQSYWKYSLKLGHEIIRRTGHRLKKGNIVDSWVLLDKGNKIKKKNQTRLGLCYKAKRNLADFSSKCKEASGKETD